MTSPSSTRRTWALTGDYGYRYLDHYWADPGRHPFLFQVDHNWAGFALVREIPPYDMVLAA